jgi:SnoaL-like domain
MTVLNETSTMEQLAARIGRLEATESLRQALNDYFYLIDGGRIDELLDVYTENVTWSATNVPFGYGETLSVQGRAQVRSIVESLGYGGFRHHGLNVDIQVDDAGESATTVAYMLIVSRSAEVADAAVLLGGLYEGEWVRDADRWRIASWRVDNQWMVDGVGGTKFFEGLREYAQWDGRPRVQAP